MKDNHTVGHVPKNLALHFSFFLARDFNKGFCEVASVRMDRGGGYGVEIPCIFKLYGPKQFVELLERLIDLPNISMHSYNITILKIVIFYYCILLYSCWICDILLLLLLL